MLDHVSNYLGETLVGSSLLLSMMQKAREQEILEIMELKRRSIGMALEVDELRKSDQETKKLLFEKSQETLRLHARNGDLRAEVGKLKEKLEEVTQLRKKSAQLEVMVGQLKEELARMDKLFQETKKKLTNDVV